MQCKGRAIGAGVLAIATIAGTRSASAQAAITRVSVDSSGNESLGGYLFDASISPDGRFAVFSSTADDLVSGDTNDAMDVFVHDLVTGATVRVSVDSAGAEGDGWSEAGSISADGRYVAFQSLADNFVAGDANGDSNVFVHDRDPDGNGIFDEGNGTTSMVDLNRDGVPPAFGRAEQPSICGDGHLVTFASTTGHLIYGDSNGCEDIFVRDFTTGTTTRASVDSGGKQANGPSYHPHLSEDGSAVAFESDASNLVGNDTNGRKDVFVRNLVQGTTVRVSVDSSGIEGNDHSFAGPLTADGSLVVFDSDASNLVANDTNYNGSDVFLHDLATGTTVMCDVDSSGVQGNSDAWGGVFSGDGTTVAFYGSASNLAPGNPWGFSEVFVHERSSGRTYLASCRCGEAPWSDAAFAGLSHDGERIAFYSRSANLVGNDTNGAADVFVLDRTIDAPTATTYGSGYPGSNGIPDLAAASPPAVGTTLTLGITNSSAAWTISFFLIGTAQASTPTGRGGTILVAAPTIVPFVLPPAGTALPESLPFDPAYAEVVVDLQVVEVDAGAQSGLSFTAGLELRTGR